MDGGGAGGGVAGYVVREAREALGELGAVAGSGVGHFLCGGGGVFSVWGLGCWEESGGGVL